jgi:hypothetical protein
MDEIGSRALGVLNTSRLNAGGLYGRSAYWWGGIPRACALLQYQYREEKCNRVTL